MILFIQSAQLKLISVFRICRMCPIEKKISMVFSHILPNSWPFFKEWAHWRYQYWEGDDNFSVSFPRRTEKPKPVKAKYIIPESLSNYYFYLPITVGRWDNIPYLSRLISKHIPNNSANSPLKTSIAKAEHITKRPCCPRSQNAIAYMVIARAKIFGNGRLA